MNELKIYQILQDQGFSSARAKEFVEGLKENQGWDIATREDLQLLQASMKTDLQSFKDETKSDFQSLKDQTRADLQSVRDEMRADLQLVREEIKSNLQLIRDEMRTDKIELTKLVNDKIEMILKEMNHMTMRFLTIVTVLGTVLGVVFKLAGIFLK